MLKKNNMVKNMKKKKHYLVTGGVGFIGSHLTEKLINSGHHVTVIDNLSTGEIQNLNSVIDHPKLKVIIGSVLDGPLMESLIRDVDEIYHLASAVGVKLIMDQPVETIENIYEGTAVVFKFAARYRKKVLLTSTSEVYGKNKEVPFKEDSDRVEGPTHSHRWAYACAKSLDEFLALAHAKTSGLPVVIVRLFNTVGPRQASAYGMVIPNFINAALEDKTLNIYGDGTQTRCFCHVLDVVEALSELMQDKQNEGEVFNVGSIDEISISKLADHIISMTKSRSKTNMISYETVYPDGGFEDMLRRVPSIEKINNAIGWSPSKSLDEIILNIIDSKKNN